MCWTCMNLAVSPHRVARHVRGPPGEGLVHSAHTARDKRHSTCPQSNSCEIGGAFLGTWPGTGPHRPLSLQRCLRVSGGEVKGSLERVLRARRRESPLFRRGHHFLTSWNQRWAHVRYCAEGVQLQNGYGSVPFLCAFSDSKDAAELLRVPTTAGPQIFIACLHVRLEIWRDSRSWRLSS